MKEVKKENTKVSEVTKEKKKNGKSIKIIMVLIALLLCVMGNVISIRTDYLNVIGINEEYLSVLNSKIKNDYIIFGVSSVIIYILSYILNCFTKRGVKKFFEQEKKEFPKLPNKSISFILALIGGGIASAILADKFAIFKNAAEFGQTDPIFNMDIGYYMFSLPFIQSLLIFIIELLVVAIVYTALYYVIVFNVYFDGIDGEMLKKNTFIKQEIFIVILITIVFCIYIFVSSQNILTGTMLSVSDGDIVTTELVGAGKTDTTIKLWGYRALSFVILISVLRLLKYVKKENFKQGIISILIVPIYLCVMFFVMIYFQTFHVKNNELDNQKEYIGYNIRNTKMAYGIDMEQQNINSYKAITQEQVTNNQEVIKNIPVITKNVTLNSIKEHQENSIYYNYENTFLSIYKIGNENKLLYITPREILADSTISYNNKTFKYTHGYSAVISSVEDENNDGYAEYLLSDFKNEKNFNIIEPRIYFGLETNSTIMVNTKMGSEYDYPVTATTNEEYTYHGKAGLNLKFLDRLILAISEKNLKLVASSKITQDTKIISNRNIIERAKKILPYVLYDEEPYLVVTNQGRLVWVLDGYTRSNDYPYSQTTTINIKGYKERINYIRNSLKVLIDAYDGTTTFYITDKSDPVIMTYRNMYPDLFTENAIPSDIQSHLVYPKFLYNIQAGVLDIYHEISEDTLYRADDIWQITTKASSTNSTIAGVAMEPYYTMLKTIDSNKPELGLILTYNKYGKQSITSYLVGTVRDGKSVLSLYKFNSESNVAGIMQLNNQIEQNVTITKELNELNTTGTRLIKDMIIVPINNTLLYIEPIYQVMLNDESEIPVLKKVIVGSGNVVAIGDNLNSAINNLFNDDYAVDLEFIDIENVEALIDSVIKANNNLKGSLNANDFEMIGKDITSLQTIINQLETARKNELAKEQEETKLNESMNNVVMDTNAVPQDNIINTTETINTMNVLNSIN